MKTISELHEKHFNVMVNAAKDPDNFPAASEHEKVSIQYCDEQNKVLNDIKEDLNQEVEKCYSEINDLKAENKLLIDDCNCSASSFQSVLGQCNELQSQVNELKCKIELLETEARDKSIDF